MISIFSKRSFLRALILLGVTIAAPTTADPQDDSAQEKDYEKDHGSPSSKKTTVETRKLTTGKKKASKAEPQATDDEREREAKRQLSDVDKCTDGNGDSAYESCPEYDESEGRQAKKRITKSKTKKKATRRKTARRSGTNTTTQSPPPKEPPP